MMRNSSIQRVRIRARKTTKGVQPALRPPVVLGFGGGRVERADVDQTSQAPWAARATAQGPETQVEVVTVDRLPPGDRDRV